MGRAPGGGCGLAAITRCCVAWGKFNELLPVLTSRGRVYNPCIRSAMLHASKTWAQPYLTCITTKDQVGSQDLLERMQLNDLAKVLCHCRLRWHGHVERNDGWLKKVQKLNPTWGRGLGHPSKTWTEVIDIIPRTPHQPPAILSSTPQLVRAPLWPQWALSWLAAGRLILF